MTEYPNLHRLDCMIGDFLSQPETKDLSKEQIEEHICHMSPWYWMEHYGWIEQSEMEGQEVKIVQYKPRACQKILKERCAKYLLPGQWKRAKIHVLKSRKMGISTFFALLGYWFMREIAHMGAFAIADKGAHTDNLFKMMRLAQERDTVANTPQQVTMLKRKYGMELSNGSSLELDSGKTSHPGTSQTIRYLHMSENAKWEKLREAETSLLNSVPRAGFAFIVRESTAFRGTRESINFERATKAAASRQSNWDFIFLEWPDMEDCSLPILAGEELKFTEEEETLLATYSLTEGNIKFLREKRKDIGEEKRKQEFPLRWQEPFEAAGSTYFPYELVEDRMNEVEFWDLLATSDFDTAIEQYPRLKEDIEKLGGRELFLRNIDQKCHRMQPMQFTVVKDIAGYKPIKEWREDKGFFKMWIPPNPRKKYILGIDPAEGIVSPDYVSDLTAIEVIDCVTREQVAEMAGHYDEEVTARHAVMLAEIYNKAMIAVEINNKCGGMTIAYIQERYKYQHLYRTQELDQYQRQKDQYGWRTTGGNKQSICAEMRRLFKEYEKAFNSADLLNEMLFLIEERGRLVAGAGATDDRIIAFAIAQTIIRNSPGLRAPLPSDIRRDLAAAIPKYPDRIRRPGMAEIGDIYKKMEPAPGSARGRGTYKTVSRY